MEEEKKYELIEKWIDQTLTPEEQKSFAEYQAANVNWEEEVQLHRQLAATIGDKPTQDFHELLQDVDQDWEKPAAGGGRVIRLFRNPALAVAAGMALLLGVFGIYYFSRPQSMPALYAAYHEEYPMVLNQRSEVQSVEDSVLTLAIGAYQAKDYETADLHFVHLMTLNVENEAYPFYHGLCRLERGNLEDAILTFQAMQSEGPNSYQELARWYLALACLKSLQTDRARKNLTKIKAGQYKYEEAQIILNELPAANSQ
ncbi:MAG: hypothetical protein AAGH79_07455 [Bacteroidota bacterium]